VISKFDDELVLEYVADSRDQLARAVTDLRSIEEDGSEFDGELMNSVHRAMHAVKAGAAFLELEDVCALAQRTENMLSLICSRTVDLTPGRIRGLISAADRLSELIEDPFASIPADTGELVGELAGATDCGPSSGKAGPIENGGADSRHRPLRTLLVEDDFVSRLLLQTFLSRFGECHIAVNGSEAVKAFRSGLDSGVGYDLVCMDIMMPEMDGREAVRQVRAMEEAKGIGSTIGAKIFMTTSVHQIKEVASCYRELCDAYLVKPIDLGKLLGQMELFKLVP